MSLFANLGKLPFTLGGKGLFVCLLSNLYAPHLFTLNWRLRWKKGTTFFTQNWTLSKTLQISHAVLFRCIKQCSVCFFAEVFFVYEILRMQKSLYLWSHQYVTGKTVISLIIQQNIDLLQRVTLKSVDFRVKPLQFWFSVNVRPQRR